MSWPWSRSCLGGILVTAVAALGACGGADETSCAYWADRLARSGEIEKALDKSAELKCVEAIPVLKQMFDDGLLQESVLTILKDIDKGKESLPILRSALVVPSTARQAASLVREWKLPEAKPELVRILTEEALWEAREPALEALLELDGAANNEDVLIGLVLADPNRGGTEINKRAISELGKLGSKKAVPTLVKAIYLRSVKGQEVFLVVRHALAQIGDASILDELLGVLAGTNEAVLAYAKSQGIEPHDVMGTPKTVQVLADTLDPRVIEPLIADLSTEIVAPLDLADQAFERWRADKSNRLKLVTFAIGHIGSDTGISALGAILRDAKKDTLNQRVNAANALAMLGTEAAQDVLIKAWREEIIVEVLKAGILQIVALGIDDRRLPVWDEMLGILPEGAPKPKKPVVLHEAVQQVLNENERIKAYIGVVRECQGDVACYLKKAKSENQDEQVKALAILGRGRFGVTPEIKAALLAAFDAAPKPLIDTKRFALMGLTRLGNQADGEAMVKKGEELIAALDAYWGEELFSYGNGLKRRMLR